MPRPKSPQRLLEEALAAGDLEAAKLALIKVKEKPKVKAKPKPKIKSSKQLLLEEPETPQKNKHDEPFRVVPKTSDADGQAKRMPLKTGIQKNSFKPGKNECLNDIDKNIRHQEQDYREPVNIRMVKVTCDGCGRNYQSDSRDVNRKIREDGEDHIMENLCNGCIYK